MDQTIQQTRSSVRQPRLYNKHYLPGYTGFVPTKNDLFAKTAGNINREVCAAGGVPANLDKLALLTNTKQELKPSHRMNTEVYSNHSRYACNWISGPTHEIRRQHVPGYTGQIQGMVNRGFYSIPYAPMTAQMYASRHPVKEGNKGRFMSSQRSDYRPSNFRRFGKHLFF